MDGSNNSNQTMDSHVHNNINFSDKFHQSFWGMFQHNKPKFIPQVDIILTESARVEEYAGWISCNVERK